MNACLPSLCCRWGGKCSKCSRYQRGLKSLLKWKCDEESVTCDELWLQNDVPGLACCLHVMLHVEESKTLFTFYGLRDMNTFVQGFSHEFCFMSLLLIMSLNEMCKQSVFPCSGPAWIDQASGSREDPEQAEDPQSGCSGQDSPWDSKPQALQTPTHN